VNFGGVVAHQPRELEDVGPGRQVERGEGVPEGVVPASTDEMETQVSVGQALRPIHGATVGRRGRKSLAGAGLSWVPGEGFEPPTRGL
jgi:hypothetical protein